MKVDLDYTFEAYGHVYPVDIPASTNWPSINCKKEISRGDLGNCGVDMAGEVLEWLIPKLDSRLTSLVAKDSVWQSKGVLRQFA